MNKRVLPRERKTLRSDTKFFKDCPMVVKSRESICQLRQRDLIYQPV